MRSFFLSFDKFHSSIVKRFTPIFQLLNCNAIVYLYQQITTLKKVNQPHKKYNMKLSKLFFSALIVFTSANSFAQDTSADDNDKFHTVTIGIPEIALLDLEAPSNNTAISLAGTHSGEAGDPISFDTATDSSLWLNYSSIVSSSSKRSVTVAITGGSVPGGLDLNVLASNCITGDGTIGTPTSKLTLTTSAQDIITNVGSAYTETGISKGHNLTYSLSQKVGATEYANLKVDSTILTITYTLGDDI